MDCKEKKLKSKPIDSAKTEKKEIVTNNFLKTVEGLTIPAIFNDYTYVTQDKHTIPAFILPNLAEQNSTTRENSEDVYYTEEITTTTDEAATLKKVEDNPAIHSTSLVQQTLPKLLSFCQNNILDEARCSLLTASTDDSGNVDRFSAIYGDILRYDYSTSNFLIWNKKYWETTNPSIVKKMCENVVREYRKAAAHLKHSHNYDDLEVYNHSKHSCNYARINAMLKLLQARYAVSHNTFDRYDNFLNVKNGIVNLQTGELMPHDSKFYLTHFVDVDYAPNIHICNSIFFDFLASICCGDTNLMTYIQLCFGYGITGDTREQILFILHGSGANGKTTLTEAIRSVIPAYVKHLPIEALTGNSDGFGAKPNPELVHISDSRIVLTSEANEGSFLN